MMDIMDALKQVTSSIKNWADDDKVQKVSGKGLSTNDYTNAEKNKVANIANDLVVLDGKLYLAQDGVVLDDSAVTLPSGGSGGGGSSASITLKNLLDSTTITAATGGDVIVRFSFASSEDDAGGTCYIYVGDVLKGTASIISGANELNISSYVSEGTNIVKLMCMDQYSNSKSLSYTVEIVSLKLSSNFDATITYDNTISYTYTPFGDVTKTVYFIMDGSEIGTSEVTTSGRQQTYNIPKQSHGSHKLEVYFTAEFNGNIVQSNHLYYDLVCINADETTPIIACAYNNTNVTQYETINIPYIVYSPTSLTSNITLSVNGITISSLTVDRTQQTWSYRADDYGTMTLTIICGTVVKTIVLTVSESEIDVTATTDNLELYLSSYGRSNNESNPATWTYGDIACTFTNYNWTSDGWQIDNDGYTVHRVTGDARLIIPLKMFASDFRTTGGTIEFEFATSNVRDYDTEVISCYSGNIGFKMTAQMAMLKSEQSEISTQYKEDEHIRLAFVIEKRAENRLIYIYLNGIMCGAAQYPTDDDFTQSSPVNITIGSNDCTIDLYNIRVYKNDLTRYQILDNWIADTQDINLKIDRYTRNNIYDAYGNIVINKLPSNLPYLILKAKTLPQYKGNKITLDAEYVNPLYTSKSFTATGAQADVQGTSSAGYARKNYKIKYKNGFVQNGETSSGYKLRDDSIPTSTFTYKADVASSEGANNVELVRLYNDSCPYKTPPQKENASVRQGIDGFPIVIFQNDGDNTTFIGRANFNNDKGTPEVYGFTDGDESWETLNNTSNRALFKSADFSGDDWTNDFEARYPEDNMDTTNLARFAEWVVSTDRTAATNNTLASAVVYDGVSYTKDTADYRLAKFKAEINNYAELDSALFYYLFTELFLMVDSRAKNAFPSMVGGDKICWLPYDMDTAIGIDNEGKLSFSYELEDIDKTETNADVYNGQQSVFWCNIRDAFRDELKAMYQELRSDNKLSYDIVENAYEAHQVIWPEAIWNEDAYFKYLQPLIDDGSGIYLAMLQGSKSEQRKWWLYNRFRYLDAKYNAGDSLSDFITLRGYAKSDITITPYASIYASVKFGSYLQQVRALRGSSYTITCPLDNVNDTEIYIYSASQLKDTGDLSGLKVGLADFSMATKLQNLKVGDKSTSYSNSNLLTLTLGNNVLLKTLDARNCVNLGTAEQQTLDLTGCTNIEEIYLEGTAVKGVNLPNGGILKILHLPDTVTNLTIRNQASLSDFVLNDSSSVTTLRLENVGALMDVPSIINGMADGSRIRIINADWSVNTEEELDALFTKIDKMRGLDENGNNVDSAVLSGRCRVSESVSDSLIGRIYDSYPDMVIDDGSGKIYIITYKDRNGDLLYSTRLADGEDTFDPIEKGYITTPDPIETDDYKYFFVSWSELPKNVHQHYIIIAQYTYSYPVRFYTDSDLATLYYTEWVNSGQSAYDPVSVGEVEAPTKTGTSDMHYSFVEWNDIPTSITGTVKVYATYIENWAVRFYNDGALVYTQWVEEGSDATDPVANGDIPAPTRASTAQYDYTFSSWDGDYTNVTEPRNITATYTSTIREYTIYFYNGETLVQTVENVQYGSSANYTGGALEKTGVDDPENYEFKGWNPLPVNIQGDMNCYAWFRFTAYLQDDWDTIAENVANGTATELYPIGGRKEIPFTLSDGTSYTADVEIIEYNHDDLADGSGKATLTFFSKDLCELQKSMNSSSTNIGGWEASEMRTFLNGELFNAFPDKLKAAIKPVYKISDGGFENKASVTTTDNCWLASYNEVGFTDGKYNLPGQGDLYSSTFSSDKESRKKELSDGTGTGGWWLRSSYYSSNSSSMFLRVTTSGGSYGDIAFNPFYVAFGFCI